MDPDHIRDEFEEHAHGQRYYSILIILSAVVVLSYFLIAVATLTDAFRSR